MDNIDLQIALLKYFHIGKPLLQAADDPRLLRYQRKEIIKIKDSLVTLGYLHVIPGMKTSGTLYRTTAIGREHLQQLQERMEA